MKVLCFGSANIDIIYAVDHIVTAGETIASTSRTLVPGGKGLNQSIALQRAGIQVYHAGAIGKDGEMLRQVLSDAGVNTEFLRESQEATGNAIIQVDSNGQNCIVLYAGANHQQTKEEIGRVLSHFGAGDMILLQNEINLADALIDKAYARGLTIVLNPSPISGTLDACDLGKVDIFLLNEVEGERLTGESDENRMLDALAHRFPKARIVLTLGEKGALYRYAGQRMYQQAYRVAPVDTTAAGDTFTGFFLSAYLRSLPIREALRIAAKASSISVCRKGASASIPTWDEVMQQLLA